MTATCLEYPAREFPIQQPGRHLERTSENDMFSVCVCLVSVYVFKMWVISKEIIMKMSRIPYSTVNENLQFIL
jgi:hypothetical protein